jgi:hypothetical protein
MSILKQAWSATKIIAGALFAVGTSPFARMMALCFLVPMTVVCALVFWAGFPANLLWRTALPLLLLSVALSFRRALNRKPEKGEGPVVYDKAKYHYDGDYRKGLARKQAFVHTGMFVGWLVEHDMIAKDFLAETEGFKERRITGPEIYEAWDGCLITDILTDEGNRFAADYFDFQHGEFLNDYQEVLAKGLPSLYHVKNTWQNYEAIRQKINLRYENWKKEQKRKMA